MDYAIIIRLCTWQQRLFFNSQFGQNTWIKPRTGSWLDSCWWCDDEDYFFVLHKTRIDADGGLGNLISMYSSFVRLHSVAAADAWTCILIVCQVQGFLLRWLVYWWLGNWLRRLRRNCCYWSSISSTTTSTPTILCQMPSTTTFAINPWQRCFL